MLLVSLRPRYLTSLRFVTGVRQIVVDHPLQRSNFASGDMCSVTIFVSLEVVQHRQRWHTVKIVHAKIAIVLPSL